MGQAVPGCRPQLPGQGVDQTENAGEVLAGGWSTAWVTCHKLPLMAGVEEHNSRELAEHLLCARHYADG